MRPGKPFSAKFESLGSFLTKRAKGSNVSPHKGYKGIGSSIQSIAMMLEEQTYQLPSVFGRVQGAGCRVQGAGCRVQGAGFRVQGFRVPALRVRGQNPWLQQGIGDEIPGSGGNGAHPLTVVRALGTTLRG